MNQTGDRGGRNLRMVTMVTYANGNGAASPNSTATKVAAAVSLVHRRLTPQQKAVICANILDGLARYVPTQKELADTLGVPPSYIMAARKLSLGFRDAILHREQEVSFAALLKPSQSPALPAPSEASSSSSDSDATLEAIARSNPDRLWHALEIAELSRLNKIRPWRRPRPLWRRQFHGRSP